MDQFMKMRKKMSMAESTRQVLNKSIDLLHKLSNKKIAKDTARKELSAVLSQYFSSLGENSSIDQESKVKLEIFLDQAYEIIEKVDAGDAPLYEAIMMMNKVVVNNQMEEPKREKISVSRPPLPKMKIREDLSEHDYENQDEDEEDFDEDFPRPARELKRSRENSRKIVAPIRFESPVRESRQEADSNQEVGDLVKDVLKKKEALERSVKHLNGVLQELGFELRSLSDK